MRKIVSIVFLLMVVSFQVQSQVTLYASPEHRGIGIRVNEGSISRMAATLIGNDRLASIIVPSGWRITLYEHENFMGYAATYNYSLLRLPAELAGKVSSVVVTKDNGNGWVGQSANGQAGWNTQNVTIFTECYYSGASNNLLPTNYPTLPPNFNRRLSSIRIPSGYEVDLFTQPNFTGRVVRLRADQACVPAEWNNIVASIKIYKNSDVYLPPNNYDPWAQNNVNNNVNTPSATLYDKCNYGGMSFPLSDGEYGVLPYAIQQRIYSIRLQPGKEILLYSGPGLTGSYYRLAGDRDCMASNNEFMVSSVKIQPFNSQSNAPNGWGGVPNRPMPGDNNSTAGVPNRPMPGDNNNTSTAGVPNRPMPTAQEEIKVFNDCNYRGATTVYNPGVYPVLIPTFSNNISSIRVPYNRRIILYTGINYTGHSYILTKDNACLVGAFNNRIRSAIVEAY